MPERIKVAEYQRRPLEEIEFPDGSVWTLRQPLEEDYYRRQEVLDTHMARVKTRGAELAERAKAKAEAEEQRLKSEELVQLWRLEEHRRLQGTVPDDKLTDAIEKAVKKRVADAGTEAGRAVVEEESDEATLPIEYTLRYLQASVLAIFITPEQDPGSILKSLPPDLMHYLNERIVDVIDGGAAKKRVRGDTPR